MKLLLFLLIAISGATELPPPQATLELEWDEVKNATGYEVKLQPEGGGDSIVLKVEENRISQRVPVGTYNLQMRSKDSETGYYGVWSAPTQIEVRAKVIELLAPPDQTEISEPKERRASVQFEWSPVPEARQYIFRVWDENINAAREFKTTKTSLKLKLPTGRVYYWQVTFVTPASVSYQATPNVYSFSLLGRQLMTPIVDPAITSPPATRASWSTSAGAEFYRAKLAQRALDETDWQPLYDLESSVEAKWDFKAQLKPGAYRIEVTAHAKNRVQSEPGVLEFVVKPTEEELQAALKPVMNLPSARENPSAPSPEK